MNPEVAKTKKVDLIAALEFAIRQQKWSLALSLARRLSRASDLTKVDLRVLQNLARRLATHVERKAARRQRGTKLQARAVLAILRKISMRPRRKRPLEPVVRSGGGTSILEGAPPSAPKGWIGGRIGKGHLPKSGPPGIGFGLGIEEEEVALHRKRIEGGRSSPAKKPPSEEPQLVERIPHMDLESGPAEKLFVVHVFANMKAPDTGSVVENLKIRVPRKVLQFTVGVTFSCSPHFRIEGADQASLVFWRTKSESTVAKFTVSLVEEQHPGLMFFVALFHFNDRPSGKITRFATYDRANRRLTWIDIRSQKTPQDNEFLLPNDVATSNLSIDFKASPSDIRIEVLKTAANDGRTFDLRCFTPAGNWKGPWILPHESETFVKAQMANFVEASGDESIATLKGAGIQFWNSVPPEARDLLLTAFRKHPVATISVLSEEPFVPWELMIPVNVGDEPAPCLGVTYSMGRWVTGDFRSPAQSIPMRSAFIVAPENSGLALAPREAAFLKKTLRGSRQIKPVSFKKLNSSLKTSSHDIVHFICHGETTRGTSVLKLDPDDVVSSTQVIALDGFLAAFRRHPFIFLNSCEVGQEVRTLAGLGGFPNAFLRMGAAALVAPLWSVDDPVAEKVCKRFYAYALAGKTFGDAMKTIRGEAFNSGTDTFASYCYYGDPKAKASKQAGKG